MTCPDLKCQGSLFDQHTQSGRSLQALLAGITDQFRHTWIVDQIIHGCTRREREILGPGGLIDIRRRADRRGVYHEKEVRDERLEIL
jgi:hypothetical protein